MAKKRRKKSPKCPEPFNTLIDLAAGATMNAIANKMEEKHHYRKRGVPNPYKASAIGFAMGKLTSTEDIIKLGGVLGAMGSFDPDDTFDSYEQKPPEVYCCQNDNSWEYDDIVLNSAVKNNKNKYAWRMNCEDGSVYGVYPQNYETRQEYNCALAKSKEGCFVITGNETVISSMQQANTSEIIEEQSYEYYKVSLIDNGKNDYYLACGLELLVGDFVLVPTESGNKRAIIIQIKKFPASKVPKPFLETECIIEKINEDSI